MKDHSAARTLVDRLNTLGVRVALRNNRLAITPAKAYAVLSETDKAEIAAHRGAVKALVRDGYVPANPPERRPDTEPASEPTPKEHESATGISEAEVIATLTWDGDDALNAYTFAAPTRYDRLFTGLVAPRPAYVPEGTTGWEHLRPEDTRDADYGRILERAYAASTTNDAKGLASPTGFEPVF